MECKIEGPANQVLNFEYQKYQTDIKIKRTKKSFWKKQSENIGRNRGIKNCLHIRFIADTQTQWQMKTMQIN